MKKLFGRLFDNKPRYGVPADKFDPETVAITKPISSEGRGFFSMVTQAMSNLYDLRDTYSKFYFDYTGHSLYDDDCFGETNYFNNYFVQDKTLLKARKKIYFDWTQDWFARRDAWQAMEGTQREIVNGLIHKHLKIQPAILEKIEAIKQRQFAGRKVLGLHKRGTDHGLHGELLDLDYYIAAVDQHIDQYDCLYLATDEADTLKSFKAKYKDKLISLDHVYRSEDGKSIHMHNFADNYKKGEDVLIEAVMLSSVDFLLKTTSNITLFSILYNKDLPYKRIDTQVTYHRALPVNDGQSKT